jgi:esterase/lipase
MLLPGAPLVRAPRPLPGAEPLRSPAAPGVDAGVLLCHGFTGTPFSMRAWAGHLAAAGLAVSLPRLPGHGTSWREANLTGWEDWVAALDRELDDLAASCSTVFVMGLSMGGTLALRLAQVHPQRVAGLVLVNPSLLTLRPDARLLPLLRRVTPSWRPIGSDIKRPFVVEQAYERTPLHAAASLHRLWRVVRADLPLVTAPLLVYRSAVDHVVEAESTRVLLAGVSSGEAEERVLHDSYHVATLDNDAPEIYAGSLEFVRRHTRAAVVAAPARPSAAGEVGA